MIAGRNHRGPDPGMKTENQEIRAFYRVRGPMERDEPDHF